VEEMEVTCNQQVAIKFTISLGVGQLQGDEGLEKIISKVDNALYTAKEEGRNMVVPVEL
jgi:diguanylate cyclase (GGDEF)-like protein